MKIAIDLNDVLRDFSYNFIKYYCNNYNRSFDTTGIEIWSQDLSAVFPFKNEISFQKFMYEDYVFELFGKCSPCTEHLEVEFSEWINDTLRDIDSEEPIEVMFVSTKEYGLSIGQTYFFISKIGSRVRETYFPEDSTTIWDKCDVLITANPDLLASKPDNKISIKIKAEYNGDSDADFTFSSFSKFLKDKNNTLNLLEAYGLETED